MRGRYRARIIIVARLEEFLGLFEFDFLAVFGFHFEFALEVGIFGIFKDVD